MSSNPENIDTPFVVHLGAINNTLNHQHFNTIERKRISAEITAMAKATTNLVKLANILANLLVTIGLDNFLVQHSQMMRSPRAVRLGQLRIDSTFVTQVRPARPIPYSAPTLCLSRSNGSTIGIDSKLYFDCLRSVAWDSPVSTGDFAEIYWRAHRGAWLDHPTPFGHGELAQAGRERNRVDLSEFESTFDQGKRVDAFGRSHSDLFQSLQIKLFGNLKTHIVQNAQAMIDLYLEDLFLFKLSTLTPRIRSQVVKRWKIYLQPVFIKDGHGLHSLSTWHPALRLDSGRWLDLQTRRYICFLLQPLHELLYWALKPSVNQYQNIAMPPLGHHTTAGLQALLYKFHTWRFLLQRNPELCTRMLPAMRYAQRYRYSLHDLDPAEKGDLPGPTLMPMNTRFKIQPLYMDAYVFMGTIIKALNRPRAGIPGIHQDKLKVNHGTAGIPQLKIPTLHSIQPYKEARRNQIRLRIWFKFFDLQARCRKFDPLSHTYRKFDYAFPIERIGISSTGKFGLSVTVTLKLPSKSLIKSRPHLAQSRFHPVGDIHHEIRNKLVPHPDEEYPGTMHTGSISHLSRAPVILPIHVTNREVAGGDFGQKDHVAVVYAHQATAHQAMVDTKARLDRELQINSITASQHERRSDQATLLFDSSSRRVKNSHSQMATLNSRANQIEKQKRKQDRQYWSAQGNVRRSAELRIDELRGHQHVFKGTEAASMYEESKRISQHHRHLGAFSHQSRWLEKAAFQAQIAKQSYYPRMAAYIANKTTANEFYFDRSPLVKGTRVERESMIRKRKKKTSDSRRKAWLNNPPVIGTGTDGAGHWAAGQPAARGLGMVKHLADIGVTVIMVPETGTSEQDPLAQPRVDYVLPAPSAANPGNPASGLPDYKIRDSKALGHWCDDNDHKTKLLRLHTNADGSTRSSHNKQRYCIDRDTQNLLGLTSVLHPNMKMRKNWRIRLSTYQTAPGFRHQEPQLELAERANGEQFSRAERRNNDQKNFSVILHRDIASADLQRSLVLIAAHSHSHRPAYNDRSGFYAAPDQTAIQRWFHVQRSRHVRMV